MNDHPNAYIVKAIITLAHNLQMQVIAEGVETKEQLDFLIRQHCDFIQGYYFSKPQPVNVIETNYLVSQTDR